MEKLIWSAYEDNLLRHLRQERNIKRWTEVARVLADEYNIKGKNGKNCKQRYKQIFDNCDQNKDWSVSEQKILFSLHNEFGNKWAIISRKMKGKSDNCIKNRFYSRLRKGLKNMNKMAEERYGNLFKQLKFTVIFKIIEATEDGYKNNQFCEVNTSNLCFDIKNKLIALSYADEKEELDDSELQEVDGAILYEDIKEFVKSYKRKPKKFRRIPTKNYQMLEHQQASLVNSCQENNQISLNSSSEEDKMEQEDLDQNQNIEFEECFKNFDEQNYKVSEVKAFKKRRQSAQTVGVQSVLYGSGIMEEEPQLPIINLLKKRTSYFEVESEQCSRQDIFFEQCDPGFENFFLKELVSMKRISQTDQCLFK